jgi:hypothetical protein
MQILQLFAELIALPQNAIHIKCYDFEGPMNSICHYLSLIYIQLKQRIQIFDSSDAVPLSSAIICCATVHALYMF